MKMTETEKKRLVQLKGELKDREETLNPMQDRVNALKMEQDRCRRDIVKILWGVAPGSWVTSPGRGLHQVTHVKLWDLDKPWVVAKKVLKDGRLGQVGHQLFDNWERA